MEASALVTALAIGVALGAVGCGGDANGDSATAGADTGQQHSNRPPGQKPCQKGDPEGHTLPAKILGNNAAGTTTEILLPVNVWSVGDCQQVTEVEVGAAGWHASSGVVVINRIRGSHALDGLYIVIPDSGAVKITDAPLGPKVVTSAQQGELQFKSKRGLTGTVNLSDDTATLSTGAVIQPTKRPLSGAG